MDCVHTDFRVDSSNRFPFKARKMYKITNVTEKPTYAGIGNLSLSIVLLDC